MLLVVAVFDLHLLLTASQLCFSGPGAVRIRLGIERAPNRVERLVLLDS